MHNIINLIHWYNIHTKLTDFENVNIFVHYNYYLV